MDLRYTADGKWVLFHDATLKRTMGLAGSIRRSRWNDIKNLDAGGWFARRFRGETIPLVEEALRLCRQGQVDTFLDVKVPGGEKRLMEILRKSGWSKKVTLGFGKPRISSLRGVPTFWVTGYHAAVTSRRIALGKRCGITGFAAYKGKVTPSVVERVHAVGLKLYVWTIQTAQEFRRYARMGADGLMSEVWPPPLI